MITGADDDSKTNRASHGGAPFFMEIMMEVQPLLAKFVGIIEVPVRRADALFLGESKARHPLTDKFAGVSAKPD